MKTLGCLAVSMFAPAASHVSANADTQVVVSIKPIHSLVAAVMEGVGYMSALKSFHSGEIAFNDQGATLKLAAAY